MKPILSIFALSFLISDLSFSQAPAVEWTNEMGTSGTDYARSVVTTPDGGYLVLGYRSGYFDGDATCFTGQTDVWLFKYAGDGTLIWQRCYGGNFAEDGKCIIRVDGGYMIAASSASDDGDVTGHYGPHGLNDVWLFKINEDGDITWQKNYGGSATDIPADIIQTADGGYIIAAVSNSTNHDVTGFHGGYSFDYWVFKINASGVLQWQKCLGGTDEEEIGAVVQLSTGEYIIGGYSHSTDFDVVGNHGINDMWIIKLNAAGSVIWKKCYGGTSDEQCQSMAVTDAGDILLAGKTSSNDGDVSGFHGYYDAWIAKIDPAGNLINQVCYGDGNEEYFSMIRPTTEHTFIIAGERQPTGGGTPGCFGSCDFWALKIDSELAVKWEECIGTIDCEAGRAVVQSSDGYLMAGDRYDDIDGGAGQICMYKIADDCVTEICNAIDDDCDGVIDNGIVESISISPDGPTTFCQGGGVILTAIYTGATLQWKKNGANIPGATNATYHATKKATYTCTTTSICGTATSDGIYVMVNKNPYAFISAGGATTFCAGGSVVLTETPAAGSVYQWFKGATAIAGETSLNYTATTAGNYKCRVTKTATGCYKNSNGIIVNVPCREDGSFLSHEFEIFPNPTSDQITITCTGDHSKSSVFIIMDITGKTISKDEINIQKTIDISTYPAGIYFIKMDKSGDSQVEKFVKE